MCIAFSAKSIYEFAFSKDDSLPDAYELDKSAIRRFCATLTRELSRTSSENPHHRYVYLAMDGPSVEGFFQENRHRFLDFGKTVVLTATPSRDMASAIESKYDDPLVTRALRKARAAAREKAQQ